MSTLSMLIIQRDIDDSRIIEILRHFFKKDETLNISSLNDNQSLNENQSIVFNKVLLNGTFKIQLDLHSDIDFNEEIIAKHFAKSTNCDVIISDDSVNPYTWWLINPNGEKKTVSQIPSERDEFIIDI